MLKVECFGASSPQDGREMTKNQDAFHVGRYPYNWAALADGAGNAQDVGNKAIKLLGDRINEAPLGRILNPLTWIKWMKSIDHSLREGPETTLTAAAVVSDQIIGVNVGDSRAYLIPFDSPMRILTENGTKSRLGSGKVQPSVFQATLKPRDVLLLVSDGVWTQLSGPSLENTIRARFLSPFVDIPTEVTAEASRKGKADDMTAVALRLLAA